MKRLANSRKLKELVKIACVVIVLLTLTGCSSDPIDTTGNLIGVVTDLNSGEPISGALVSLSPTGKAVTTGTDGKFEFQNLDPMLYNISASKINYKTYNSSVSIKPNDYAKVDIQLMHAKGELILSNNVLDFGEELSSLSFDIENKGSAIFKWELGNLSKWISCSKNSGELHGSAKTTIVVTVERKGLESGNYSHLLTVISEVGSAVINVKMKVSEIQDEIILKTENASSLTYNSAKLQGKVLQDGGHIINGFGFCYSQSPNPTVEGMKIEGVGTKDLFYGEIKGLKESSTYYVKSYVLYDSEKYAYGNEILFETSTKDIHIDKNGYEDDENWSNNN